jgi:hypothetical protein
MYTIPPVGFKTQCHCDRENGELPRPSPLPRGARYGRHSLGLARRLPEYTLGTLTERRSLKDNSPPGSRDLILPLGGIRIPCYDGTL